MVESIGKGDAEHDSGLGASNKKLSDLISNLGGNDDDGGDENVIEEEEV